MQDRLIQYQEMSLSENAEQENKWASHKQIISASIFIMPHSQTISKKRYYYDLSDLDNHTALHKVIK